MGVRHECERPGLLEYVGTILDQRVDCGQESLKADPHLHATIVPKWHTHVGRAPKIIDKQKINELGDGLSVRRLRSCFSVFIVNRAGVEDQDISVSALRTTSSLALCVILRVLKGASNGFNSVVSPNSALRVCQTSGFQSCLVLLIARFIAFKELPFAIFEQLFCKEPCCSISGPHVFLVNLKHGIQHLSNERGLSVTARVLDLHEPIVTLLKVVPIFAMCRPVTSLLMRNISLPDPGWVKVDKVVVLLANLTMA